MIGKMWCGVKPDKTDIGEFDHTFVVWRRIPGHIRMVVARDEVVKD